jgi:hypothetical protein
MASLLEVLGLLPAAGGKAGARGEREVAAKGPYARVPWKEIGGMGDMDRGDSSFWLSVLIRHFLLSGGMKSN